MVDALGDLVAKSMVTAERRPDTTRYQLLETMRAYAREQLETSADADGWRRRHAGHYAAFAEVAGPGLRGPDEVARRVRLGEELDNLRAAVTWGLDAPSDADAELAVRIIANLAWEAILDRASGIGVWAQQALGRAGNSPAGLRAAVLGAAAIYTSFSGDQDSARPLAISALEGSRAPGCPAPTLADLALGVIEAYSGNVTESLRIMLAAQREFADAEAWVSAGLRNTASSWAGALGNEELARTQADEAVRFARLTGSPSILATALWTQGQSLMYSDPTVARRAFDESVELSRRGASTSVMSIALAHDAWLRASLGDHAGALDALRESVVLSDGVGDQISLAGAVSMAVITFAEFEAYEIIPILAGGRKAGLVTIATAMERERTDEAAAIEGARIALGDARFAELERQGATMTYDDLIASLIGEIDRLLAEVDDA